MGNAADETDDKERDEYRVGPRGPLLLFDMDGTLLRPDSWRENGVGFLYEGVADIVAPLVDEHLCGLLTGCEVYRIKGALRATDARLERWLERGHFFCEMGLVQLVNGRKVVGTTDSRKAMLDELRSEMKEHYDVFPGSDVMVTLTPRYDQGETIEGLKKDFLIRFSGWAERLTVTTSSEAVDLMPAGFTKANGIEMARDLGYFPIHFVADSWGDVEALEKIRDEGLGLAGVVGQAKDDVKERWENGKARGPYNHVQLEKERAEAIDEFLGVLEKRFPGRY